MNKLQLLESIREHHSNLPTRQLELYIETIGNKIALETNITKKTFVLNSVAGKRWYDLSATVLKIEKIYFNDVLIPRLIGEPIIDDDEFTNPVDSYDTALATPTSVASNKRMWMLSDYDTSSATEQTTRLGIVEKVNNATTKDGRTSNYQSCSITSTSNIRVFAITAISNFINSTTNSSSPGGSEISGPLLDLPVHFHDVLLNGAISMGYKNPKSFNGDMYTFFNAQFLEGIKDIKKFVRTKHSTGFIKPQDF
tara:strand:- start:10 stop:768 length:759 start_codon:yes stop_codon:yes gene_type:complete